MGCSRRKKFADIRPEQKWDFISLNDFKSSSFFTPLAYGYLYVSLLISIAVYGVDTFTAVNLLAFNKWTSEISPVIPISVARWIFSGCIIASWVNLGFEWVRAIRVMRRGAVAESYLDSLAVRLQSIRPASGRGWRRFLVFAELTKSKKGAEYVALFAYFSFQAWIRVIFCSGPRQVINALTLYSVYKAKLDPEATDIGSSFTGFFKNIEILAESNYEQAVVLSGMIFTLIIWVFAALSLLIAVFLYVFFLWHYIPNRDGGLSGYCERKINSRLTKIVSAKVNKALEEEERKKRKAEEKALKKGEKVNRVTATVPNLDFKNDDKLPEMPMLNRQDTMTTLPVYSSRPGTPSNGMPSMPDVELNSLDQKRPYNGRSVTQSSGVSNASYSSNTPLIGGASGMGYAQPGSSAPSLPALDTSNIYRGPQQTVTGSTNGSGWQQNNVQGPQRTMTGSTNGSGLQQNNFQGPQRTMTGSTNGSGWQQNNPPQRTMTGSTNGGAWQQNNPQGVMGPPPPRFAQGPYTQSPVPFSDSPAQYGPSQQRFNSPGPQQFMDNYGRNGPAPQQTMDNYSMNSPERQQSGDNYGRPMPRQVTDLQGGRAPGNMLTRQATLPDMEAGQPTLPNVVESGQPTLPNVVASGQPTLPNIGETGRQSPAPSLHNGRSSPAPSQMGRSSPAPQSSILDIERPIPALRSPLHPDMRSGTAPMPNTNNSSGYVAFNPSMRSASAAPNPMQQQQQYPGNSVPRPPYRNMTAPASQSQQQGAYFGAPRVNTPQQGPPRVGTPQGMPPRVGTPQGIPPRVGTPQGQQPRPGTANSMRSMPSDYRQPHANEVESPQSYSSYQQYPENGSTSSRPRPPPPDDRYQY